jgi:beta-lactamase regulating signal transducer with metallopeptidase domain
MSIPTSDPALIWALLHSLWQSAPIAALTWVALKPIPARHPGLRYWLALASLAAMLLAFAFTWRHLSQPALPPAPIAQSITPAEPSVPIHVPSFPAQSPAVSQTTTTAQPTLPSAPATTTSTPLVSTLHPAPVPTPSFSNRLLKPILPWLSCLYLVGVAAMIARLLVALLRAFLIRRNASPITLGNEFDLFNQLTQHFTIPWAPWTHARLALSHHVRVPSVIGFLYPLVLLPARGLSTLSPEDLKPILAHELAHVRRMDALVNLLQSLAESFLFFNPAIWWINRVIRQEREACCDTIALKLADTSPRAYANALYNWAQMTSPADPQLALTGPNSRANGRLKLLDRVNRLLRPHASPELSTPATSLLLLAILAACLLVTLTPNLAQDKPNFPVAFTQDPSNPTITLTYNIQDLIDSHWKMRLTSDQVVAHLIATVATPDFWNTNNTGQTPGAITRVWSTRLIVNAPKQTHLQVLTSLTRLRELQDQAQKDANTPLPARQLPGQPAQALAGQPDFTGNPAALNFTPAQESAANTRIDQLQTRFGPAQTDLQIPTAHIQVRLFLSDGKPLPPQARAIAGYRCANYSGSQLSLPPSKDGLCKISIPVGIYALTAYVPGYSTQSTGPFWANPNDSPPIVTLTLTPNAPRKVLFVDKDNQPLNNLSIRIQHVVNILPTMPHSGGQVFLSSPITFAGSSVEIPLPPAGAFSVKPLTPGFIDAFQPIDIPPGNAPITVALAKSPTATGRILDADSGLPIPNASVTLARSTLPWPSGQPATIQTNTDGLFCYSSFQTDGPENSLSLVPLWVTAPGYAALPLLVRPTFGAPIPLDLKLPREFTRRIVITGDLTRLPGYPENPHILLQREARNSPADPFPGVAHMQKLPLVIQNASASAQIPGLSHQVTTDLLLPGLRALTTTIDLNTQSPDPIRWHLPKATDTRQVKIHIPGHTPEALNKAHFALSSLVPDEHPDPDAGDRNIQFRSLDLTFDANAIATMNLPLLTSAQIRCPGISDSILGDTFLVTIGPDPLFITRSFQPLPAKGAIFGRVIDAQSNPLTQYQIGIIDTCDWPATRRILHPGPSGFACANLPLHDKNPFRIVLLTPPLAQTSGPHIVLPEITLTPDSPVQEVLIQLSPDGKSAKLVPTPEAHPQ